MRNNFWVGLAYSVIIEFIIIVVFYLQILIFEFNIYTQMFGFTTYLVFMILISRGLVIYFKYKKRDLGVGIIVGSFIIPTIIGIYNFFMLL